jgi:hypothetical protein
VTFHDSDLILLLVSARPGGPAVASPEGFRFLRRTDHELRRLPGVADPGLRSLPDLIEPPAKGTLNLVTPLDEIPDDPAAFARLRARLRAIPAAEGLFLSPDGRASRPQGRPPRGHPPDRELARLPPRRRCHKRRRRLSRGRFSPRWSASSREISELSSPPIRIAKAVK